jgi:hypothetical protein
MTPFHIRDNKPIYSDHNAIELKINWKEAVKSNENNKAKRISMNDVNKNNYAIRSNSKKLEEIVNITDNLNKKYTKWEQEVISTAHKCFTKVTTNKYTHKNQRHITLLKRRRELMKIATMGYKTEEQESELDEINKQIQQEIYHSNIKKTNKLAEKIKNTGINNPKFWDILKMDKKPNGENKTAMHNSDGKLCEDEKGILRIHEEWFRKLLTTPSAQNEEEERVEQEIEEKLKIIECKAKQEKAKPITIEELEPVIRKLKNNKASDVNGMRNEYIKYAGLKLKQSLLKLLNEILITITVPKRWEKMRIRTIYKNKGDKKEIKNYRGIFITNIVSKVFEKILHNRNQTKIDDSLTPFQCGSRKGRGTVDHLFTLQVD